MGIPDILLGHPHVHLGVFEELLLAVDSELLSQAGIEIVQGIHILIAMVTRGGVRGGPLGDFGLLERREISIALLEIELAHWDWKGRFMRMKRKAERRTTSKSEQEDRIKKKKEEERKEEEEKNQKEERKWKYFMDL